jgi:hypothetical protein
MKHLKKYNEEVKEIVDKEYINDILQELGDDLYITKVLYDIPNSSSISISIKKRMSTGYSVIKISDILPTIYHIISYMDSVKYSNYNIEVQPLWHDENHLIPILSGDIDTINPDNSYGEFKITFSESYRLNWHK